MKNCFLPLLIALVGACTNQDTEVKGWQKVSSTILDESATVLTLKPTHIYSLDGEQVTFAPEREKVCTYSVATGELIKSIEAEAFYNRPRYNEIVQLKQGRADSTKIKYLTFEESADHIRDYPPYYVAFYLQQENATNSVYFSRVCSPQFQLDIGDNILYLQNHFQLMRQEKDTVRYWNFNTNPAEDYKKIYQWPFYGWKLVNDTVLYSGVFTEGEFEQMDGKYLGEYRYRNNEFQLVGLMDIPFPKEYIKEGYYNYFWNTFQTKNDTLITCNGNKFYELPSCKERFQKITSSIENRPIFNFWLSDKLIALQTHDEDSAAFRIELFNLQQERIFTKTFDAKTTSIAYAHPYFILLRKDEENYYIEKCIVR